MAGFINEREHFPRMFWNEVGKFVREGNVADVIHFWD